VSCRNLLIYLDRPAQQDVLEMFHFSLLPGGYLFLGSSETVDAGSRLFAPVDKSMRIYRANPVGRPVRALQSRARGDRPPLTGTPAPPQRESGPTTAAAVHRDLLEEFAPPTVLVNAEGQIVHVSKHAARYLRYASGEPSHSLLQALPTELRPALRPAIAQATQLHVRIEADPALLMVEGGQRRIRMAVLPVRHPAWPGEMLLVSFDDSEDVSDLAAGAAASDPGIARLEEELQKRSDQLRTTIEQYEASAEELKASNEELQAINEELRSTTEELETSKEELQSTNEELTTVNSELKAKIDEAAEVNDDLGNLISSSDIATVFVDPEMRIKRFTPAAAKIFNLIAADVGRSLFDITHRLEYRTLAEDAQAVFSSLKTIEREVQMGERRLLARLLPYRTGENRIGGAVLNFVDVTSLREAEVRADVDRERAALVAETMTDFAILTMDPDGRLTSWNPGASNVFGYSEPEALGQPFDILFTEADRGRRRAGERAEHGAGPGPRPRRALDAAQGRIDLLRQRRDRAAACRDGARLRQDLPRHDGPAPGRGAARAGPGVGADERGAGGRRERAEERVPCRDVARAEAPAQPDQRQRPAADDAARGEDVAGGAAGGAHDPAHRDEPGPDHRRPARHVAPQHRQADGEPGAAGARRGGAAGGELGRRRSRASTASACSPRAWTSR
jgi:two-component system CheB/CheR fusion protein